MRLTWTQDDGHGRAALSLDAPLASTLPLNRLLLDAHPAVLSYDRVAVAGALAFGPWLTGAVELPGAVSPDVARAVDAYCAPNAVQTWPVTVNAATHFSTGRRMVAVADAERLQATPTLRGNDETLLHLRRSDRCSGSLIGLDQVVVASNAYLLASTGGRLQPLALLTVAVASLFAEDLGAATLALPVESSAPVAGDRLTSVNALLASVDLSVYLDAHPTAPRSSHRIDASRD